MPPKTRDWSVFNIRWDGRVSLSTVWRGGGGDQQVFRSWVDGSSTGLDPVYHVATYDHPVVDIEYFHAQERLGELMGRNNLWFAGVYAYDIVKEVDALGEPIRGGLSINARNAMLVPAPGLFSITTGWPRPDAI